MSEKEKKNNRLNIYLFIYIFIWRFSTPAALMDGQNDCIVCLW